MNSDMMQAGYRNVAEAVPSERATFIRKTYVHLAGAILAFALIEAFIFQTSIPGSVLQILGAGRQSWLIVLLGFMGVSWVADKWARSDASVPLQYAGLALYVVAEAIIFIPLLAVASQLAGPDVILSAAVLTALLFTGLTFTAFTIQKDFTFLGGILKMASFLALGVIVASILFGFTLGVLFSAIMIALAAAAILYNTSAIMYHYNSSQYVAASLSLFASVALLFWYILRILMGMSRRN